jgi:hypothetical protein
MVAEYRNSHEAPSPVVGICVGGGRGRLRHDEPYRAPPASGAVGEVPRNRTLVQLLQDAQQIANPGNRVSANSMRTWSEPLIKPDWVTGVPKFWQASGSENAPVGMSTTLHLRPELRWSGGKPVEYGSSTLKLNRKAGRDLMGIGQEEAIA